MKQTKKMDKKLVAEQQSHESEVKYIASTYKIPIGEVRRVMKENAASQGTYCRSRKIIYAALREKGYEIKTRNIK